MKNYYMVQASTTYGGNLFKAAYLPYAAGLLVASANADKNITSAYNFKRFIFIREDISSVVESLDNPFLVGFSCYIWNTEYNKALSAAIKNKYPNCIIVFGGHNVPPDSSMLQENTFIDFLMHGEGEESFPALLNELNKSNPSFKNINGLTWRIKDGFAHTEPVTIKRTDFPSPYLTGVFDDIIRDYPNMQHDAIIETSRGCPRNCSYCDWGCTNSKVKLFPIERIKAEIDWMAEHKVAFIWGADANFGAFKRDMEIVDYFIETRKRTGYPERIRINYAKDKDDTVFEISRKFEEFGLSKEGATLSFQSLNPNTLIAIGRNNMTLEHFKKLIARYKAENITTYSELIVGLPCETYDSFCNGIGKLLDAGQHRLIEVYNCELLPNSLMGSDEYIKKYGIKTAEVVFLTAHSNLKNNITEKTKYIIGTNTMDCNDWIRSNIFYCFEKASHHYGLMRYIAMYIRNVKNVRYEDFYNSFISWAKNNVGSVCNSAYSFLFNFYTDVANNNPVKLYSNEIYGKITWAPEHVLLLEAIYRLDDFYVELMPFFKSYGIDENICKELIDYEKCVLKRPNQNHFSKSFTYNWHDYFNGIYTDTIIELKRINNTVCIDNSNDSKTWPEYALEAAWFGKNGITFNTGITVKY